jgi:hypothetical protein
MAACRDAAPVGLSISGTPIQWVEDEPVQCLDPSERDSIGPFFQPELGELWSSQLHGDITEEERRDSAGLAVADLTGDGRYELVLPHKTTAFIFRLERDGTMSDLSDQLLPDRDAHKFWGTSAADVDGDGDIDLFMQSVGNHNQLYRNQGDGVLKSELLMEDEQTRAYASKGSAWGDMDQDGDLDLVVSNETTTNDQTVYNPPNDGPPNQIYENLGGAGFKLRDDILQHEDSHGYTFLSAWLDIDNDTDQDLYMVNAFGHRVYPNRLLINHDGAEFEQAEEDNPLHVAMDGMGLGVGDLNRDGYPDLLVSDWGRLYMMESIDGIDWVDTTAARGLTLDPEGDRIIGWGTELQDLDNDGDLDAAVQFGLSYRALRKGKEQPLEQPDGVWLQNEDGIFEQVADDWEMGDTGGGRGLVLADLNDDGYLDLIKRELYAPAQLYLSRCGDAHWIKIRLAQPGLNTRAVGARLVLEAGGQSQSRWLMAGGTGLGSSGPMEVHFGLGDVTEIDRITVYWPDGEETVIQDIGTNRQVWILREGASRLPGMPG